MHPELKRLASNVSQWPAGYKWLRSDSSVQMMTMSRNDYAPDKDHHWFNYQEWYQARRALDFPLPSGRIDVAPALPVKPAVPAIEVGKQCIHGDELMWVIGENHFHPGYYFLSLSETQLQTAVKQVSGEYLKPVTEELSTLIELTNSVVISKKIIEAGFKRG